MLTALANAAQGFIGLFQEGGKSFTGMVTGILPTLVVLITAVNSLIKIIGEERVNNLARSSSKYLVTRYTVFPVIAVFFLTNPMAYTFGKFLDEKYKPAYYDSTVSFVHAITGLFPHANPAELFVYMGIAQGITKLGLPVGELAVRYFITGVIVIFIKGLLTERITIYLLNKEKNKKVQPV
ncbi:MAG: PTS glucitol/sorbitol transporter subunit IIC [Clostridium sp.]|jgi:PTS system glucitol/sorbitol-specific IIC component|uniref:PTS glucitol/sorbitol transporter subunit IIC n=1 Tax=Clostridium sp. TaxID=1506 RepID=UPI0025BDA943|nr:PTS glucitol/sorbitol transporter subunit IIC [Clostridium sp.]MCH3964829.1 PTS glucitol/sorbitol transporter subunit IIC [Clostridium sp.]MCI1717389.1 PTS glucitol/sorbitol transporter subunit IIC [Clostridium sp.]MCI1801729.1 PTS glucitol/sorbitol transporter subunit IIC [Clostridium sp.]MCI1814853.1 PTS glucitol/sorbitol transporter subunit IIC [Clostridium sp.]MCI1872471.1 PTS glucitol/sorbitol transporter subunit IIC [Clostridium sp.]